MIHPDTIVHLGMDGFDALVDCLPLGLQTYHAAIADGDIWELYGTDNPAIHSFPTKTTSLMRIEKRHGNYEWYDIYFKEHDHFVTVTEDEMFPIIVENSMMFDNDVLTKFSVIQTSIPDIRKMKDCQSPVFTDQFNAWKPLVRRSAKTSDYAYRLVTASGLYHSHGVLMLDLVIKNISLPKRM